MKLGSNAQVYEGRYFGEAIQDVQKHYANLLSDDDKFILDNYDHLVDLKNQQAIKILSKFEAIIGNVKNNRYGNKKIEFGKTVVKTGKDSITNEPLLPCLAYDLSCFNNLNVIVYEAGRKKDIYNRILPNNLMDNNGVHMPDGNYVFMEKKDLLNWLKVFDINKVANASKIVDNYKAEQKARRAGIARGSSERIDYSKLLVFYLPEEFGSNSVNENRSYSFEDITKMAEESNRTVVYNFCNKWREQCNFAEWAAPTTKEEERNFKISDIRYDNIHITLTGLAKKLGIPEDKYIFVYLKASDYKKLKLWNAKDWLTPEQFVNGPVAEKVKNICNFTIKKFDKEQKFTNNFDNDKARTVLQYLEDNLTADQKATKLYAEITSKFRSVLDTEANLKIYNDLFDIYGLGSFLERKGLGENVTFEIVSIDFRNYPMLQMVSAWNGYYSDNASLVKDNRDWSRWSMVFDYAKLVEAQ